MIYIRLAHTLIPLQFVLSSTLSTVTFLQGEDNVKKRDFSFPFSPFFIFIRRLNEFSVFLHTSFLLDNCHQVGKGCKERWCRSGFPNIRQNYVTKLRFEIIRNS